MQRSGVSFSRRLVVFAACLAVLASACSGDDVSGSPDTSGEARDEQPTTGGTLRYLLTAEATGLDNTALSTTAVSSQGMRGYMIYDMLVKQDNATGEITPGIAESVTTEDDVTWRIDLRPGVEFSDGTPYDAAAVQFNLERHADPASGSRWMADAAQIESMTVVDEQTLDVVLANPDPLWPRALASSGLNFVGSPTAMDAAGADFGNMPVGAGPFVVTEWVRDSSLVLERNPSYWDAPRPYVDRVEIRVIPDEEQRFATLQTGDADMMTTVSSTKVPDADGAGLVVDDNATSGGRTLTMQVAEAPFDDARVRRALLLAIDRENLNDVVFAGTATVADSLFLESKPFYDEAGRYPEADMMEAQRLVDDYEAETGESLEFTFTAAADNDNRRLAEHLQSAWSAVGADVDVEILQGAELREATVTGNFQITSVAIAFNDPFPTLHQQLTTGGSRNFGGYTNPDLDAVLETASSTSEESERAEAYAEAQQILLDEVVEPVLFRVPSYHLHTPDVRGLRYVEDGVPRIEEVWLAAG